MIMVQAWNMILFQTWKMITNVFQASNMIMLQAMDGPPMAKYVRTSHAK